MDSKGEDVKGLLEKSKWSIWNYLPARYFLTFMFFMGLCITYCIRVGLSIALVAMVNNTETLELKNSTSPSYCENPENDLHYDFENKGEFYWDPYIKEIIVSSFYYGHVFTHLPGGWLSDKFGGKWLFGGGIVLSSLSTLLIPIAARAGYNVLIVVRVIGGFVEGVTYPAMFVMIVYWSTLKERSFLLTIACMGGNVGSILATPIAAALCENGFAGGWPSVFYVFGVCGCVWFLIWVFCVFDKPSDHPWISQKERLYLEQNSVSTKEKLAIPWKSMLTSVPIYALLMTRFSVAWGLFTLMADLPLYLAAVFKMSLKQNGLTSAIMNIFLCLGMVVSGYVSDYLRRNNLLSINIIRKGFEGTGLIGCGICLIILPQIGCNLTLIIVVMSAGLFLLGFNSGGSTPTVVDMAPEFAGTICGISATLSISGAFFGPLITGVLTKNGETIGEWNMVFYIMAGVLITGTSCFLILGSAEVQPWAKVETSPCIQRLTSLNEEEICKTDNCESMNSVVTPQGESRY